jgi:hypothetical protein
VPAACSVALALRRRLPTTLCRAGKETPFQYHFDTSTFALELTLRIDVGAQESTCAVMCCCRFTAVSLGCPSVQLTGSVDMCWSVKGVPELFGEPPKISLLFPQPLVRNACGGFGPCTTIIHQAGTPPVVLPVPPPPPPPPSSECECAALHAHQSCCIASLRWLSTWVTGLTGCVFNIHNFRVVEVPYEVIALTRAAKLAGKQPPTSIYVAVRGVSSFSRFELVIFAHPAEYGWMVWE